VRLTLQPSLDPSAYRYVHQVRTRFAETDAMGIIHHGNFPAYLEEARAALLRESGFPYEAVRAGNDGIDFAVLEFYLRHRRPLRFDDLVDVHVVVEDLTRTTFQVGYLLTVEEEVRATAVTVHGAVDVRGRPSRMPAFMSDLTGSGR
jgi:acyl-CoA thioester hydrolase